MLAEFYGDSDGAFFEYDSVAKNRKIVYPMLPKSVSSKLSKDSKVSIPQKIAGEKRILSADIALLASNKFKNDATAIFINQLLPTKAQRYSNNIVYTEAIEGAHTEDLARKIRIMFDEFMCDYLVLDVKNMGIAIFDALVRDITDPDTGEIYPALSCCNNEDLANRCSNKQAEKAIWAINASSRFNSECAVRLREGFKSGKIRLLETEYDGEKTLAELKGFNNLPVSEKVLFEMPYINTTLLINELINLQYEESGGFIKIYEKGGMRKDRYSSLSYNYWVATELESRLRKRTTSDESDDFFIFRAPKIKKKR